MNKLVLTYTVHWSDFYVKWWHQCTDMDKINFDDARQVNYTKENFDIKDKIHKVE